jgi:hypothetical protein
MMTPRWEVSPYSTERRQTEELVNDAGEHIAIVEEFWYGAYPSALNAATGNWERGGCHSDRAQAFLWAERVAGVHPVKASDARPAFYYRKD